MNVGLKAGTGIAAIFAAVALAAPMVVSNEGWRTTTYLDPVAIPTACAGVTGGVVKAKTYTDAQCRDMTSRALLEHAIAIRPCLPESMPVESRAAFSSFAYNVGAAKFCSSTISRKALAGDLKGACAELSRWVYAGKVVLPGLVERRKQERALCERGLA